MRSIAIAWLLVTVTTARAEEVSVRRAQRSHKHLVYVEALGKGGLYGLGYEFAMTERLGVGGALSYSRLRELRVFTVAPYLHARIIGRQRHSLFGEIGAIFAHSRIPSPVKDWDGESDSGGGGFFTVGWQYVRGPIVVRTSGGVAVGEGGVAPMLGFAFGGRP